MKREEPSLNNLGGSEKKNKNRRSEWTASRVSEGSHVRTWREAREKQDDRAPGVVETLRETKKKSTKHGKEKRKNFLPPASRRISSHAKADNVFGI